MTEMLPFWSKGRLPSGQTLHKYGLSLNEWIELFNKKNGCCHICGRPFEGRRANVDHEHVKGWNKMAPEERHGYIRGLLCYQCNKFMVMRGVTSERLWQGWQYMRAYEVRIKSGEVNPGEQTVQSRNVRHTNQKKNEKHQTG